MSDKIQDDTQVEDDKISFGEKLKKTREKMGLSVQEAAARLHLRPRFISMLENENLSQSTLPLIYLRGYLRSYSKLLNIPDQVLDPILEKLDPRPLVLNPQPVTAESLSLSFPLESNPYYARIATFFISLALLTLITAWWYLHANTPSHTEVAQQQTLNNPEATVQPIIEEASKETLPPVNNVLLEATTKTPVIELSAASNDSVIKKPVTLAAKQVDDDDGDEQE